MEVPPEENENENVGKNDEHEEGKEKV